MGLSAVQLGTARARPRACDNGTAHRRHFSQGDASDSVKYIQKGAVKLSVPSQGGKEAVVAMLGLCPPAISGLCMGQGPSDAHHHLKDTHQDRFIPIG